MSGRVELRPLKTADAEKLSDGYGTTNNEILLDFNQNQDTPIKGNYFRDNLTRVDFILVYNEEEITPGMKPKHEREIKKKELWRDAYLKNLKKLGLDFEEDKVESGEDTIIFIKISVPWNVQCQLAEDLSMKVPLQIQPIRKQNFSDEILTKLHMPNVMRQAVPKQPPDYFTCDFKKSKLERFLGSENPETFFKDTQRHRMVFELLETASYGKRSRAEIGISRLLQEEVFTAAYPLHDGPDEVEEDATSDDSLTDRQILRKYWARWGVWYKYQPLDHIRDYFGEKIGIYFAWLGFYTAWLLPISIIGVLVFTFGAATVMTNTYANDVCHSSGEYHMCPLCARELHCPRWNISEACRQIQLSYLFDHPGTVIFSIIMSLWAVTFLEYWKRKNASLSYHWDCMEFEDVEERPRPQYQALATTYEKNPITGMKEPHFPDRSRIPRIATAFAALTAMILLVCIFILAVIIYRVLISIPLFNVHDKFLRAKAQMIANSSSAVVNLILIMALGRVYELLAHKLTVWEMHRTQTEFEDALITKTFVFQFANFYSSVFYIAFFKGKFIGYPGHYDTFLGLRSEQCQMGGCLFELATQLAIIMVGKQIIGNIQELLIPKLKNFLQQRKLKKEQGEETKSSQWEEDYRLSENEGLLAEYLEMVLQFGFITIFVAAFPLAPFFALLNNWIEIRLDAHKFISETRRPVAERAQDLGSWFTILDIIANLAVISNAFLIAFTSDFLPQQLYRYKFQKGLEGYLNHTLAEAPYEYTNGSESEECRYQDFRNPDGSHSTFYWNLVALRLGFVIGFEHIVFFIGRLIDVFVPDVPETLELKIKREKYLAKQALADTSLPTGDDNIGNGDVKA